MNRLLFATVVLAGAMVFAKVAASDEKKGIGWIALSPESIDMAGNRFVSLGQDRNAWFSGACFRLEKVEAFDKNGARLPTLGISYIRAAYGLQKQSICRSYKFDEIRAFIIFGVGPNPTRQSGRLVKDVVVLVEQFSLDRNSLEVACNGFSVAPALRSRTLADVRIVDVTVGLNGRIRFLGAVQGPKDRAEGESPIVISFHAAPTEMKKKQAHLSEVECRRAVASD